MSYDRKILQEVFDTGNFFNPEVLKICKVSRKDLDILTLSDRVSQAALASYQHITGIELDKHTLEYHGRLSDPNGIAGPATLETVEARRSCKVPDFYDPDSPEALAAVGTSGNWKRCHGIGDFHAANVNFLNQPPPHVRPHFAEILRRCRAAFQAIGLQLYFGGVGSPIQDNKSGYQLTVRWDRSSNGWIGLAQVMTNQGCGSTMWSRYLETYMRNAAIEAIIRQICVLFLHEWGHNCGRMHTKGGIMNSTILALAATWIGDTSESWFRTMYGGKPIPDIGGPTDPDPKPNGLQFDGTIKASLNGVAMGEFQLVPKIRIF